MRWIVVSGSLTMSAVLLSSDDNAIAKKKKKRKKNIKARTRNRKCSHPDNAGAVLRLEAGGAGKM